MQLRLSILGLCLALVFGLVSPALAEVEPGNDDAASLTNATIKVDKQFRLMVDGVEVKPDVGPVVKNGEVFVPIRFLTNLRARVEWIETDKEARIVRGLDQIKVREGDREAVSGNEVLKLKAAPFLYKGRLLVPLVTTASTLGMDTDLKPNSLVLTSPSAGTGGTADRVVMVIAILLWALALGVLILRSGLGNPAYWGVLEGKEKILFAVLLLLICPLVAWGANSHFWAAMVPAGAALSGVLSRETYHNRLATMAASAMGLGILGTMLGLGFVIGPAVASHDVSSIGFGISVKIEASIAGLGLSWILNNLWGHESRD